ncbi:MAG TPA: sigma-70 family RNA polymerase sigma factor [Pseudobacter sp.]|nr:sigma-70 family RNA polymerase sigma factor [Pseudobacter sp.]
MRKYVYCLSSFQFHLPEKHQDINSPNRIPDEALLVRQASEGDQQAFGRLYSFYYPRLFTSLAFIARSEEDAQEVIHEVFLKVWKTRDTLAMVRSFEDYVYVLSKNLLFNQLKRKKVGEKVMQALSDETISNAGPAPDQQLLFKQYYQTALAAIELLSPQKKRIFLLRTQERLTLEEIGATLNISISAVKKHLYAAIEFVKEYLRQHAGDILSLFTLFFL